LNGNFLKVETWLAVCRHCHNWIHAHHGQARTLGLIQ
jgi:ribosomal protein L32